MKFVVAVDCEGPAGVVGAPGGSLNDAPAQYEFARRQATAEASAAARGLFNAGATQVVVWDTHGGGVNLVYEELDERCDIYHGLRGPRLAMLDSSYAGLLFIGYHARDNTIAAPLAHTFSSATYQWMKINGREIGEIASPYERRWSGWQITQPWPPSGTCTLASLGRVHFSFGEEHP